MTSLRAGIVVAVVLATAGCGKKDESSSKSGASASGGTSAKSSLPWTPEGYDAMSAACKKALACCEEVAKAEGAKSAEDYNGKCSGPALWKDDECEMDRKSRLAVFEADGKPVPDACK